MTIIIPIGTKQDIQLGKAPEYVRDFLRKAIKKGDKVLVEYPDHKRERLKAGDLKMKGKQKK